MTPAGVVTEFPPIPVPAGQNANVSSIVSGPGGDLWFGYTVSASKGQSQDFIGRVTTAGAVKLFPISSARSNGYGLNSLAAGADGNLWFTESVGDGTVFGRMSPSGVVTDFPVGQVFNEDVANGPNDSLILTGQTAKGRNEVFRVSTAGALTPYKIPAAISNAYGTYLGAADGSLWFSNESGPNKLGRITASGVATSYNLSGFVRSQFPLDSVAVGDDGDLYVLDNANTNSTVYRLSPSKLPPARGGR